MAAYCALGLLVGALSSLLPGPCNLAVLEAARRHGFPRAVATGFGTAIADTSCAALAVGGIGQVLAHHSAIRPMLQTVSGCVWVGYGLAHLRPRLPPATSTSAAAGLGVGLGLVLANPATITSWVVIVAAVVAGGSPAEQWLAVAGVGLGSFATYAGIARLGTRNNATRVARIASHVLVAYGLVMLVRAWLP